MLIYSHSQVKFAELTLDTFRMLQCLEWEPTGSFYQKRPIEPKENGTSADYSGPSGLIDINLVAEMTDPTLPPNPRKAILYRPSVTHLIAVSVKNWYSKSSGLLQSIRHSVIRIFIIFRHRGPFHKLLYRLCVMFRFVWH